MNIVIVDDETGEKFCIEEIEVKLVQQQNGNGNGTTTTTTLMMSSMHPKIEIDHPAIKFSTEEILIGNR
jgi:hypothetical protein